MPLTRSILYVASATAFLLLLPLVAMQFTHEVIWTLSDFVLAGILLFGTGLTYVVVSRMGSTTAYRLAVGVAVAAGLLLIWGNLAVGFIGSENNPANPLYGAVLAVGLIGALLARFRPRGLAQAMFATALTQFLVPVVAALIWKPEVNLGMMQVVVLNTAFAGIWTGSGWLFRRASTTGPTLDRQLV